MLASRLMIYLTIIYVILNYIICMCTVDIFGGGEDAAGSRQRTIIPIDYNGTNHDIYTPILYTTTYYSYFYICIYVYVSYQYNMYPIAEEEMLAGQIMMAQQGLPTTSTTSSKTSEQAQGTSTSTKTSATTSTATSTTSGASSVQQKLKALADSIPVAK